MKIMIRKDFLDKVFDYETKKDWAFQGNLPCVIDFQDDYCPPCKAVGPILERLAMEYDGEVDFYKVNIKQEEILTQELGVINLPMIVFYLVDKLQMVIEGAVSEEKIKSTIIKELLNQE